MAKKSQTNARRNNTQAARRVVNFYNHGTINIDTRQNRSRTNKTENNGCTINYPCYTSRNMIGDYFPSSSQSQSLPSTEVVGRTVPQTLDGGKSFSTKLKVAIGIVAAALVVGGSIVAIKYFN